MNKYGLTFKDVIVNVGDFKLKDVNFNLPKGTILGVVGRNGAGKTTMINSISGLYNIKEGEILVNNQSILDDEFLYLKQFSVVNDKGLFNEVLKPKKINRILNKSYDNFNEITFSNLINKFEINMNKRLTKMSMGEQKKVNIAAIISLSPKVLILDEPLSNIDPISKLEIINLLQEYLNEDKTIIYSTNQTEELDKIADYILFLEKGEVIFFDLKENILDNNFYVLVDNEQFDLIKDKFVGYLKTSLGYEGIVNNKEILIENNINYKIPSIDQIMFYYLEGRKQWKNSLNIQKQ